MLWAPVPFGDFAATAERQESDFGKAMARVMGQRDDVRQLLGTTVDGQPMDSDERVFADQVLDQAALLARGGVEDLPRVLVVGDSSARSLAWGFERWAVEEDAAVVWTTATDGCGLADQGDYRPFDGNEGPVPDRCTLVDEGWPEQVRSFDPDVVLVLSTIWDLSDRRPPGSDEFHEPGDEPFDEYLLSEYRDAVDVLSAGGARIVWLQGPCSKGIGPFAALDGKSSLDPARVRHLNEELLPRLAEDRPQVRLVDVHELLCPGGEYQDEVAGIEGIRPDGIHFSTEGALWLSRQIGPQVLEAPAG